MSTEPKIEILRVVTYNNNKLGGGKRITSDNTIKSGYFYFLLIICIGSTCAIPTFIIFVIGLIFPFITIASQSLWEIALYVIISYILSLLICHCYRYEVFELYFNKRSIQKRIMMYGWNEVMDRMHVHYEDALSTSKLFRFLPYVLMIANRIDKNVLWFVQKTTAETTAQHTKLTNIDHHQHHRREKGHNINEESVSLIHNAEDREEERQLLNFEFDDETL